MDEERKFKVFFKCDSFANLPGFAIARGCTIYGQWLPEPVGGNRYQGKGPGDAMEMTIETLADDVTKVNLAGKLDMRAALKIDPQFKDVTDNKQKIIVDLEQVSFLASLGIRTMVMAAKAVRAKGGRIVLLNPRPDVEKVLTTCEIDTLISIKHDLESAVRLVSG
jgi:anti-anti-sigma factor